jgi:hypothetical protein
MRRIAAGALFFGALLGLPAPADAQVPSQAVCPDGAISFVFVDNHSIYDPDDLSEETRLAWVYRLTNRLHIRTNASFIRSELLFREGDCYDPALLDESARLLRRNSIISKADVYGLRQADSTWHVIVDTRDEWTTKINFPTFALDDGVKLRSVGVREENVLGRGILVGAFFREREERKDAGGEFFTPRLPGIRLNTRLSAGTTRVGHFLEQSFVYPFVGERGRFAGRQIYGYRDDLFPYSLGAHDPQPGDMTHVLLPLERERAELTLVARLGEPGSRTVTGNLTTFGIGISRSELRVPGYPGNVEVAREKDFNSRDPAPDSLNAELVRQAVSSSGSRLNLLVGQRNLRLTSRGRLDALTGVQDFTVGTDFALTLGRTLDAISREVGQDTDLYGRLHGYAAFERPTMVGAASLDTEARQILSGTREGWSDVLGQVALVLYVQPERLRSHTFFFRAEGTGGWRVTQPFQLLVGGERGLRGYEDTELPAAQRLIFTVEDRIYVPWPLPNRAPPRRTR